MFGKRETGGLPLFHWTFEDFNGPFRAQTPANGNGMGHGVYFHTRDDVGRNLHGDRLIEARGPGALYPLTPYEYGGELEALALERGLPRDAAYTDEIAQTYADLIQRRGFGGIRLINAGGDEVVVFDANDIERLT